MSLFARLFGGADDDTQVDAARARALLSEGAVLLDVRTPPEHQQQAIPGSTLLPLADLPSKMGSLDPNKTYVVYCRSGGRSAQAAGLLKRHGFARVYDLGGIGNWR
ncbi:MAG: rhodanese-like domain-containing protein [Alphaproteobacteria bacterium]|nr:rhodanese-like domain-containing protein [Alphaproteobacteria bacterium]